MTEHRYGWKCPNCETNNYLLNVPAREEYYFEAKCSKCDYGVSVTLNLECFIFAFDEINDACWEVTTRNGRLVRETEFDWAQEAILNREDSE